MDTSINILVLITIPLEITLVLEESKKLIVKFIADYSGTPTKNRVIDYMNSENVPVRSRMSRVTTLSIINELDGDRIRVLKGERRGQSHRLSMNDKSRFDWINQRLSEVEKRIENMDPEEPEMKVKIKNGKTMLIPSGSLTIAGLCALAYHTSRQIKNENDLQVLNDKILQLMVDIGIKNIGQLTKKLRELQSH